MENVEKNETVATEAAAAAPQQAEQPRRNFREGRPDRRGGRRNSRERDRR